VSHLFFNMSPIKKLCSRSLSEFRSLKDCSLVLGDVKVEAKLEGPDHLSLEECLTEDDLETLPLSHISNIIDMPHECKTHLCGT
jgi:hypothetical protein